MRASRAPVMERYIPVPGRPRWNAHSHHIKEMLCLPKKLGPRPKNPVFIARLTDNTGQQVEIWDMPSGPDGNNKSRRAHRLCAKYGDRMIALGHLHMVKF